ncbi:aldolase/citrate lyase family protein [Flavonifractor sp. An100]|uniref:aldolase/citrate lyase family protein n=1 Tax=Flavonifractor sp. An100 TaxID=1965538 RepID=UPI000B385768|nr:aldolase/citrate lyase family protein [Flavonifractor sp. An100]OUQ79832.1 aldolase [Flavonifractor sp. An100]
MLQLMYITNRPEIARIAESAGVDRIFVDLEYIGKASRQGGMDTVQSQHTLDDVRTISEVIRTAELLVRVNPIHEATEEYCSSQEEIDTAIQNGADIIMLPYFKTLLEVKQFLSCVAGRAKTMLLVETPESVNIIDDILQLKGIDCVHIGINDLSIGYRKKFMFELLTDGTVERLCNKFREKGIPYGFGGIASLGKGALPAEMIIKEHYRLGSTCAILSRSFCDTTKNVDIHMVKNTFDHGIAQIRALEEECQMYRDYFMKNKIAVAEKVAAIVAAKE